MHETAHFREDPFTGKYINTSINFTRSKAKLKKKKQPAKLSRHIHLVGSLLIALIAMIAECSLSSEGCRDLSICLSSMYTPKHFFFPLL